MAQTHPAPVDDRNWLVGNPSTVQIVAALWIGSVGLLILGLQPVLLGALFDERRIDLDQLGLVAMAEIIAIGLGSAFATMLFSTRHLRLKSAILLLALAALDCTMSLAASPSAIFVERTIAGLVEGGLVAVSIELIARSRDAERMGGYFVALQTLAQCALAFALGRWVIAATPTGAAGANAGFLALAAVSAASTVAALLAPKEYGEIPKQSGSMDGVMTTRSILALAGILTFFMCIGAIWAFLEPLGKRQGVDSQTIAFMVSASLGAQVLGALAATALQSRVGYPKAIVGCAAVVIIAAAGTRRRGFAAYVLARRAGDRLRLDVHHPLPDRPDRRRRFLQERGLAGSGRQSHRRSAGAARRFALRRRRRRQRGSGVLDRRRRRQRHTLRLVPDDIPSPSPRLKAKP